MIDANGQAVLDEQGKPMTAPATAAEQVLAVGPAASQIAIKQLGTNGGGFFYVNSAHPFENPTPWSNVLEMLAILLIPAALCYTFGMMVGDTRQGWAVLAAMAILLIPFVTLAVWAEQSGNPAFVTMGIDQAAGPDQAGGNMEGKEARLMPRRRSSTANPSAGALDRTFRPRQNPHEMATTAMQAPCGFPERPLPERPASP